MRPCEETNSGKAVDGLLAEEVTHGRPGKHKRAPNVQSPQVQGRTDEYFRF